MKNKKYLNKILLGDALEEMSKIENNSIDVILTDPPYFLDKLDNKWEFKKVSDKRNRHVIQSLPAGMKFDKQQGVNFYNWYFKVSKEVFRVLKPGGFFFSFSSPRLYHRMACAVDDAGLLIRDCFLWVYTQNQAKAMSLNHFIDKMKLSNDDKNKIKSKLKDWKTPQIKSSFEPIVMAQKPTAGTFLENILKNEVGLFNTGVKVGDNMFPSNIFIVDGVNEIMDKHFLIGKPSKSERLYFNNHMTVKPLILCEHLLKLSVFSSNAVVLDPFMGSGTTLLAARNLKINYIGIDINPEYIKVANQRLKESPQKLI